MIEMVIGHGQIEHLVETKVQGMHPRNKWLQQCDDYVPIVLSAPISISQPMVAVGTMSV